MKKFNYLFTLLLLLFGVGGAKAQTATVGDSYPDVPAAGDKVFLYSASANSFYCGAASAVAKENDDCLIELVQQGTTDDGLPIFVLKQVSTGLYLKNLVDELGNWEDTSDKGIAASAFATSEITEALPLTIMQAQRVDGQPETYDPSLDYRCSTTVEGENLFVLACANKHPGAAEQERYYFGIYGGIPFNSPYMDTNAWIIYEAIESMPFEALGAVIDKYFPNGVKAENYPVGDEPGYYDAAAFQAANAAYTEAYNALSEIGQNLTQEQVDAYTAKLEEAYNTLSKSFKPMKPGYYFILGHGRDQGAVDNWTYPVYLNGDEIVWDQAGNVTFPAELTVDHAKYIFQIEDAGDGLFTIRSFSDGRCIGEVKTDGEGGHTYLEGGASNAPAGKYGIKQGSFSLDNGAEYNNAFCISLNGDPSDVHCWHQAGGGRIVGWYSNTNPDAFRFEAISEARLGSIRDAIEQVQLNAALETAYAGASEAYNMGRSYKTVDVANEENGYYNFDDAGLVQDPGQLSSNSEATNEGEKGGSVAFVIDGQGDTYYHSVWSGATVDPEITFDLGGDYKDLVFQFARRNAGKNHLAQFKLLASNDGENWVDEGIYSVKYDKNGILPGWQASTDTIRNAVALAGFTLSQPYQYLRLHVTGTTNSEYSNGHLMTHFAEIRVYEGEFDAENSQSFYAVEESVRQELADAIAATKAALAAGTATQEIIDRVKAATEAFTAQYPLPRLVTEAKSDVEAYINHLPFAEEAAMKVGNFPMAEKTAALAKIETIVNGVDEVSAASINAAVEQIQAIKDELAATIKMPEVGKLYIIRGATSATAANSGMSAPVYVQGNDLKSELRFIPRKSTSTDEVVVDSLANMEHYYNFIWEVESVDQATQTMQLRNVGTGMYMKNDMTANSTALTPVVEPTSVKMVSYLDPAANTVSIVVGKMADDATLYINTAPGGRVVSYYIAGSYTADGDANSSLKFEEVSSLSGDDEDIYTYWPVNPNTYQIVTLPFAGEVMTMEDDEALYTVDGVNRTDVSLELSSVSEGSLQVEAGQGFVVKTAPGQRYVMVLLDDRTAPACSFEGILKNSIHGVVTTKNVQDSRALTLYSNGYNWYGRNVSGIVEFRGNSGYFTNLDIIDTKGEVSIELQDKLYAVGIDNIEAAPATKDAKIYDLSGRRVSNAQKGLYIINGKKVLVK